MGEKKEETISQKAFEVSPEGELVETSRDVTPRKESKEKKKTPVPRRRHVEGVFRNPPNVPGPMDLELDRVREEKAHKARGELLEEIEKAGLRGKLVPPKKKKENE